jgi:hypothetical protein
VTSVRVGGDRCGGCPGTVDEALVDQLTPGIVSVGGAIGVDDVDDAFAVDGGRGAELGGAGATDAVRREPDHELGIEAGRVEPAIAVTILRAGLGGEEGPGAAILHGDDLGDPLLPHTVGASDTAVVDAEDVVRRLGHLRRRRRLGRRFGVRTLRQSGAGPEEPDEGAQCDESQPRNGHL